MAEPSRTCKDCAQPPLLGGRRCERCRLAHNARATARRQALAAAGRCWVCGKPGALVLVTVEGESERKRLGTCKTHREYFRARRPKSA
jgi:hypothetical protein